MEKKDVIEENVKGYLSQREPHRRLTSFDYRYNYFYKKQEKNRGAAKDLISDIGSLDFNLRNAVTGNAMDVQFLQHLNQDFNTFHWKNPTKARQLINQGLQQVANGDNNIRSILVEIIQLIPSDEMPTDTLG